MWKALHGSCWAGFGLIILAAGPAGSQIVSQVNQAPNAFGQNNYEVDIAVNPLNPQQVVAAYIKDFAQITLRVGVSVSNDGGLTWSDVADLPSLSAAVNGDPVVAFDSSGRIHVVYLAFTLAAGFFQSSSAIVVARSSDGGMSWQTAIVSSQSPLPIATPAVPAPPVQAPPGTLFPPPSFPTPPVPSIPPVPPGASSPPVPFEDKPWMAIDVAPTSPFQDVIHVVWQRDRTNGVESDIFYSRGRFPNFSPPLRISDLLPPGQNLHNGPAVAVGQTNGEVFVSWLLANVLVMPVTGAQILFDRDPNGGVGANAFGTDIVAVTSFDTPPRILNCPLSPLNCTPTCQDLFCLPVTGCNAVCTTSTCTGVGMRMRPYPYMAIDPTTPSFGSQTIYIAHAADPDGIQCGDESDLFLVRSTDSGSTWSAQGGGVPLNRQGGFGSDTGTSAQFHPRVVVSPGVCVPPAPPGARTCVPPGTVVLTWYDRRNDPFDRNFEVFIGAIDAGSQTMIAGPAFCASGGAGPAFCGPVNPPFNTTPIQEPTFRTVGEYIGLTLSGLSYGIAWTDTRSSGAGNSDIAFTSGTVPILFVE